MYAPRLAVSFYGGAAETAASFAALEALVSQGFALARVSAIGMSAAGAALFLAGTAAGVAAECAVPGGLEGAAARVLPTLAGLTLSGLTVPLTAAFADARTGKTVFFGERALGKTATDSSLFLPDAPLEDILLAAACPWERDAPLETSFGALCGVPTAAGIRYVMSGALREREDAALHIIFAPPRPCAERPQRFCPRLSQLMSGDMLALAGTPGGYRLLLCPRAEALSAFDSVRSAVLQESERIALYCLNGKSVV